jgi:hypothetical protein
MAVRHHDEIQLREINAFCLGVLSQNVWVIARIEKNALSAVFDQRSISPIPLHLWRLTEGVIQNGDLKFAGLSGIGWSCSTRCDTQ